MKFRGTDGITETLTKGWGAAGGRDDRYDATTVKLLPTRHDGVCELRVKTERYGTMRVLMPEMVGATIVGMMAAFGERSDGTDARDDFRRIVSLSIDILRWIYDEGLSGVVLRRDIKRAMNSKLRAAVELDMALDHMVKAGHLRRDNTQPKPRRGRPAEAFWIVEDEDDDDDDDTLAVAS